jgi:uncharacterized damage-inducible protein DinB
VSDNVAGLTLEQALFVPPGGFRSSLGTLKHIAGWSHVYRSFAFDQQPKHWLQAEWPRGLRDTVVTSQAYLEEIIVWLGDAHRLWLDSLGALKEADIDRPGPLHWGGSAPLSAIVALVANHYVYHAGEINQLLSICRGEAWEETEEVEENHISTVGHRVKPSWMKS